MEIEFPRERHSAINALMGSILNNNYFPANNAQYWQQAINHKQEARSNK
ncbi:hypothetical protein [Vibrio splendidus]|nr:hypothetical protein [Vibrio splendidus]